MSATMQLDDRPLLLWVARSDVLEFSELPGTPMTTVNDTPGDSLCAAGVLSSRSAPPFYTKSVPTRPSRLR